MVVIKGTHEELLKFCENHLDCPEIRENECEKYLSPGNYDCNQCIFENEKRFRFEVKEDN